jgi:hypothetical protein
VAAEPRRTGGAYGPALPSQKANSEGARWGVTPSWHEHRPTALALRVVAGLGSSLDLSSPPWALPLHRPQVVVLMDPCKDPEDTLCVHQSREQTFIFDTVFDQHASQVPATHPHPGSIGWEHPWDGLWPGHPSPSLPGSPRGAKGCEQETLPGSMDRGYQVGAIFLPLLPSTRDGRCSPPRTALGYWSLDSRSTP